jgi:cob(I)alamin adenosyltransferase
MTEAPREAPQTPEKLVRADSLLIVNTGDGKGKSSAAFGVMGRAWARGWRVVVIQFLKSGKWQVGEKKLAEHLGLEWLALGDGFTWESTDIDETIAKGRHAWAVAKEKLTSGDYDLVILDEITYAVTYGWIEVADVVQALTTRAPATNVIVTGRNAPEGVIEIADTVTEMRMVKHAYEKGIRAKKGIEY